MREYKYKKRGVQQDQVLDEKETVLLDRGEAEEDI